MHSLIVGMPSIDLDDKHVYIYTCMQMDVLCIHTYMYANGFTIIKFVKNRLINPLFTNSIICIHTYMYADGFTMYTYIHVYADGFAYLGHALYRSRRLGDPHRLYGIPHSRQPGGQVVYMHVCTHTHTRTYACTRTYTYICMCVSHVCTYGYIDIYVCIFIYIYAKTRIVETHTD